MDQNSMIYVHIPFCIRKCNYCDFLSFNASTQVIQEYIDALCLEIKAWKGKEKDPISSVFIGGGTPSILTENQIEQVFEALHDSFNISKQIEQTIESNPGTITQAKALRWKKCGINRVSMGVQSLDDTMLKRLGRIHNSAQVFESWKILNEAEFQNLSFDLMMGLPDQTLENWEDTLRKTLELRPKHLSCYSLIIEEGTPFSIEESNLNLPNEEMERVMYYRTQEILSQVGMKQYEISNFAFPGFESKHNLGYWHRTPYIGLGLGASSLSKEEIRYHNTTNMNYYLKHCMEPELICEEVSKLSRSDQMEEFMFLGLRCTKGIEIDQFEKLFGISLWSIYEEALNRHLNNGLLQYSDGWIHLTPKGLDLSNQVFADFLLGN